MGAYNKIATPHKSLMRKESLLSIADAGTNFGG